MKHLVKPYADQQNPAIDMNDPEAAITAIEIRFPETFSRKAWKVIRYFSGAMFLYAYKGKFIVTDESLYLTEHGDGSYEAPYGFPRWTGNSLEALETWLETIADDYNEDGDIPGWKNDDEESEDAAKRQIELIASMEIHRKDNWFIGTIGGYPFQVKVTEEDSEWGIDNGRIIKLFVTEKPDPDHPSRSLDELISYERGWDTYPESPELEDIIDALYEYFQNRMDSEVE